MHQFPVGWDLISLYHQLGWSDKLFALYLALVVGFSFFRSLRLARSVWSCFPARRIGSHDETPDPSDVLAASALANTLTLASDSSSKSDFLPSGSQGCKEQLPIIDAATSRFQYLWSSSDAKVSCMKNVAVLTIILSALTLSYDLLNVLPNLRIIYSIKHSDLYDVAGGPSEILVPFVLGLAVSAVLFALSTLFRSVLARRQAEWNLFVAKVNSQKKVE